jgi:hypothetical protein
MTTQSQYRIPTQPVRVRLVLEGGKAAAAGEEVILYLPGNAATHAGAETLEEFLNRPRRFVPAKSVPSGRNRLVSRAAIVKIVAGGEAAHGAVTPCVDLVRVNLADGSFVEGLLLSETAPEHPRLSDFFNQPESFFAVRTEDGVVYVNKQHVVEVVL